MCEQRLKRREIFPHVAHAQTASFLKKQVFLKLIVFFILRNNHILTKVITLILLIIFRIGLFGGSSRMGEGGGGWGGGKKSPLPKIFYTHPTMMKLGSYTLPKKDPKYI